MPTSDSRRTEDLLASITEEMLGDLSQPPPNGSVRVELILLELVRPDPVQPRRVLPEAIHFAFHNNRLTPTQALRALVQQVQVAARQRGRPFNSVLELMPRADDDAQEETSTVLSPEVLLLRDLVNLAMTIREDGQVNPLTVVNISQGVTRQFRIETGERRYWASWLLRDFIPDYAGDGTLPCILISEQRSSVFRQSRENTARIGLTAVALARQAALLLTVHNYEIPAYAVAMTFLDQALELDLRSKREYTEAILSAMGGIERAQFSRIKALLRLSDEALELADRHGIEESRLRYLVAIAPEYHAEIVRQIIDFNLSSKQIRELCEGNDLDTNHDALLDKLPAAAVKLAKMTQSASTTSAQDIARALMKQEGDAVVALARLQALRNLLTEAERFLTRD